MKIAIGDDETHYCKQIQECVEIYLDKHHIYGKTEIFMDGNALLERGMLAEFDALFLDVEFGGKAQGMKIAREVHQRNAMLPIVFVSEFIKYSVDSCKTSALNFLAMPQALFTCLARCFFDSLTTILLNTTLIIPSST